MSERIIAAAIHHRGIVASLPAPARHSSIVNALAGHGEPVPILGEQGFLTSTGRFVNRREAKKIAIDGHQLRSGAREDGTELFSEDLW